MLVSASSLDTTNARLPFHPPGGGGGKRSHIVTGQLVVLWNKLCLANMLLVACFSSSSVAHVEEPPELRVVGEGRAVHLPGDLGAAAPQQRSAGLDRLRGKTNHRIFF